MASSSRVGVHSNAARTHQGFGARAALLLLAFASAALMPFGCGGGPVRADDKMPAVDLWPLVYYDKDMDTGARQLEILGTLLAWDDDAKERNVYIRPFWNRRTDKALNESHSIFMYTGIGAGYERPGYSETRAVFLYKNVTADLPDGGTKHDFSLLPFVVYSRVNGKLKSFAIWPFGGSLRDVAGRDRIVFVMWPFYSYIRTGDDVKYNIVWPFGARRPGVGFKIWPFYAHKKDKRGEYLAVMWPFYIKDRTIVREGVERKSFISWPFWYQEDSPGGYERAVFWPLVKWRYEVKDNRHILDAPYPFYRSVKSDIDRAFRIFPFYMYNSSSFGASKTILWPLVWIQHHTSQGQDVRSFRVVPFFWRSRSIEKGKESNTFQIWPFFKRISHSDGSVFAEFPSFAWTNYGEPFERNLAPILRLFEYRNNGQGTRDVRFFWRLFRRQRAPDSAFTEFTPFFAYYRKQSSELPDSPGKVSPSRFRFTLLKGLFDYRRIGEEQSAKVLYVFTVWRSGRLGSGAVRK